MKKCLLLFLLFTKFFAQEIPISESNAFVYEKYKYGNDFFNITYPFVFDNLGAVYCHPYSREYLKIGNTTCSIPIVINNSSYIALSNVIQIKNKAYFCTSKNIIVKEKNKKNITFEINTYKEYASDFEKINNAIYYLNFKSLANKGVTLNQFNGEKAIVLKTFVGIDIFRIKLIKHQNKLFLFLISKDKTQIYSIIGTTLKLEKTTIDQNKIQFIITFKDINNYSFSNQDSKIISIKNGISLPTEIDTHNYLFSGNLFSKSIHNQKYIYQFINNSFSTLANTSMGDTFVSKLFSPETNSFYCGTNGSLLRLFPHIKKYPRLFYTSNSNSVFTLQQDYLGQIWAGSYQGALSIITNDNVVVQSKTSDIKYLNGGLNYKDKILLFAESEKGLLQYDNLEKYSVIADSVSGFCSFISKNKKLYIGTCQKGIWFTDVANLDKTAKISWRKIAEKEGLTIENILCINEDKFGTIWYGSSTGIGVYNPTTNLCTTWNRKDLKLDYLGTITMAQDTYKTVWIGSRNGELFFHNGKNKKDYNLKNFEFIKHPLLEKGERITFLHQWKDFLIIGAKDKVLLFDLKKWHENKTVSVRYLNSMEINLTSTTEQNTILTDIRDQSIWFTTGDMVYQWNIKKWLTLPTFKVKPSILIKKDNSINSDSEQQSQMEFSSNKIAFLKPTENSFDILIQYQTRDNMPRFVNGILMKKGEKPIFENPNLVTKFQFKNLSAGEYVFYIRVCQQDGSFETFEYPMCIDTFYWQKWWFWAIVSLFPISFLLFYFKKRNQIEKQKKRLSQLNLSSLSNQFRPHFMLNALNSIGSQMGEKPHAEKVISRLGESINILYGFTQKNNFTLSFENEWKLVENSLEIQRLLFIPELNVTIKNKEVLPSDYKIPVGLFQIPIENALLHGLRNKTDGNCNLTIEFEENKTHYFITILDNGVGRQKAAEINNFKKNGNGLTTVFEMIKIINEHQKNGIKFKIFDLNQPKGTKISISLHKNIDYEKIKI